MRKDTTNESNSEYQAIVDRCLNEQLEDLLMRGAAGDADAAIEYCREIKMMNPD